MENTVKLLESIKLDLANAERIIIKKDQEFYKKYSDQFLPVWLLIIMGGFTYLFWLSIEKNSSLPWVLGLVLLFICGILYGLRSEKNYANIRKLTKEKIISNIKKHQELLKTFEVQENIDNILGKAELMQALISSDIDFLKEKRLRIFKQLMKKEIIFCTSVLLNLRSDLALRLEEQEKTLEHAKSEVEENITGTTELNQVSELQKARLDRQIEQFEELQRILVTQ